MDLLEDNSCMSLLIVNSRICWSESNVRKAYFSWFVIKSVYETRYHTLRRSCAICIWKLMVGGHDIVSLKRGWRGYVRNHKPVLRKRCRSPQFSNKYDNTERNTHTRAHAHAVYILYLYNISKSVASVTNISRTDVTECWCKLFVNGSDLF